MKSLVCASAFIALCKAFGGETSFRADRSSHPPELVTLAQSVPSRRNISFFMRKRLPSSEWPEVANVTVISCNKLTSFRYSTSSFMTTGPSLRRENSLAGNPFSAEESLPIGDGILLCRRRGLGDEALDHKHIVRPPDTAPERRRNARRFHAQILDTQVREAIDQIDRAICGIGSRPLLNTGGR